ncbi:hypothetical protein GGS21DRAFT_539590 [Xylaria nigripes]|nr:hypothetical protein GGS21DRAFT_539590 [Xylaria nigripes]
MKSSAAAANISSSQLASRPPLAKIAISAPCTAISSATSPAADASSTSASITSKEWVIPPRPKPGRKPATDTPPTKRKAQNRAAQRAFRERRAARVGELEEELEEQRDGHERAQQHLREEIRSLTVEVESLRIQCAAFKETLDKERAEKENITAELESFRLKSRRDVVTNVSSRNGAFIAQHEQMHSFSSQHQTSTSGNRASLPAFSIQQIISPPDSSSSSSHSQALPDLTGCGNCSSTGPCACVDQVLASATMGCGKCSLETNCECFDAALNNPMTGTETDLKRKPSSVSVLAPEEKRQKADPHPNEIDFTAMFSSKKREPITISPSAEILPVPQASRPPRESCGFCTESSYCMCADAPAIQTSVPTGRQVQTPPPSEDDVGPPPIEVTSTGAIKLPSLSSLSRNPFQSARRSSGCGENGPGTCSQCLRDPKSGLFCRSLAAFARESGSTSGGCCGGAGSSGCCKSTKAPGSGQGPSTGVSLSCADAYQTLSSHPGFERATDEIETWLPKLKAVPKSKAFGQRTALDVETASIMGVLKEFDVRFARNA